MFQFTSTVISTLYAVASFCHSHAYELSDLFPIEENADISQLANGIVSYIQENKEQESASIRIVLKKELDGEENLPPFVEGVKPLYIENASGEEPLTGHILNTSDRSVFAIDTYDVSFENLQNFFNFCKEQISSFIGLEPKADAVGVIIVGDFSKKDVGMMVDQSFSSLSLKTEDVKENAKINIRPSSSVKANTVSIHFSMPKVSLTTYKDLKQQWVSAFFQFLLQQRLSKCVREQGALSIVAHSRVLLPNRISGVTASCNEECTVEEALLSLLQEIESIKKYGFSKEELIDAKTKLHSQVQYLLSHSTASDNATLATFYADQFVHQNGRPSYEPFIEASLPLIESIGLADLKEATQNILVEDKRIIDVAFPNDAGQPPLTESTVKQISLDATTSFESDDMMTGDSDDPAAYFFQLPLVDWEKKTIHKIVTTMARKNLIQLAFEKKDMEKKGRKINHVHPMRFIGYAFSDNELKQCMKEIRKSSFKWDNFVDGYSRRMREEGNRNNLIPCVPGFAKLVNVDPNIVMQFILDRNYEGLVAFLATVN